MKSSLKYPIIIGVILLAVTLVVVSIPKPESELLSFETISIDPSSVKINEVATVTVNIKNISDKPIDHITIETVPKFSKNGEYVRVDRLVVSLLPLDAGATSGPKTIPITAISPGIKSGTETLVISVKINGVQEISKDLDLSISRQ